MGLMGVRYDYITAIAFTIAFDDLIISRVPDIEISKGKKESESAR